MEKKLPKNWVETELGSLAKIQSGGTPSRGKPSYWNGNIPWVKISDIKELYVAETDEFITEEGLQNSPTRIFPKGTILFTIFATIGKIGILNIDATTNQAIAGITPISNINKKYLIYSLIELSESLKNIGKGVAQSNINLTILNQLQIPLPPLPEQERIVAKLDLLFAQHEKIKTSLEKIPQILKDFRQQILTQAVTGKLTEEWRKGKELESVESILDLEIKKRDKFIKDKKLRKVKDFGEIKNNEKDLEINEDWKWIRWVDLLQHDDYSMKRGPFGSALKKDFFVECGIRVFEQYNPINDDPYFQRYFVTEEKFKELESFKAESGDLLISCSGVTLGRITEIPNDTEKGIINQALLKLTLNKTLISNNYFIKIFRSEYIQKKIFDNAKGSAIPNMVGVDVLKKIPLPIPSVPEQMEILKRMESLFSKIDAIELRYQKLKEKIDQLPQTILHKAFKGELVPQLPTDGDAKDLLKEILALKK